MHTKSRKHEFSSKFFKVAYLEERKRKYIVWNIVLKLFESLTIFIHMFKYFKNKKSKSIIF